jgi:hypothetical protein
MIEYSGLPVRGVYASRVPRLIEGRTAISAREYLAANKPQNAIYIVNEHVRKGQLDLEIDLPNGRGKMAALPMPRGFTDGDLVRAVIREERIAEGFDGKVIYGWADNLDEGLLEKCGFRFLLAEKRANDDNWLLLDIPKQFKRESKAQVEADNRATAQAVVQGLGGRRLERWWNVNRWWNSERSYIEYNLNGRRIPIYGFSGYPMVFSAISETRDGAQLIGRFYNSDKGDKKSKVLLKTVLLSERQRGADGKLLDWPPLIPPKVITATEPGSMQRRRIYAQDLKSYLEDKCNEEREFYLPPRLVDRLGYVRITMDIGESGDSIYLGRFPEYIGKKLVGKVRTQKGIKRAYFWPDALMLELKHPPLVPTVEDGDILAESVKDKMTGGQVWQVKWTRQDKDRKVKRAESKIYRRFIFSLAKPGEPQAYEGGWTIARDNKGGRIYTRVNKVISGKNVGWCFSEGLGIVEPHIQTSQIDGRAHLVELWRDRGAFEEKNAALRSSFITLRTVNNDWRLFWAELDNVEAFEALLKSGLITQSILASLFRADYLLANYASQLTAASNALEIVG